LTLSEQTANMIGHGKARAIADGDRARDSLAHNSREGSPGLRLRPEFVHPECTKHRIAFVVWSQAM
jgi:hypothetical protein